MKHKGKKKSASQFAFERSFICILFNTHTSLIFFFSFLLKIINILQFAFFHNLYFKPFPSFPVYLLSFLGTSSSFLSTREESVLSSSFVPCKFWLFLSSVLMEDFLPQIGFKFSPLPFIPYNLIFNVN